MRCKEVALVQWQPLYLQFCGLEEQLCLFLLWTIVTCHRLHVKNVSMVTNVSF